VLPVPTESMKKRDVEVAKVENIKRNGAEDAMDVERTSAQPPLGETTKHASVDPPDQPTHISTDRNQAEGVH